MISEDDDGDFSNELPEEAGRGVLTNTIDKIANMMIGRSITLRELRLIPYIQYTMCNNRTIKMHLITNEERKILAQWKGEIMDTRTGQIIQFEELKKLAEDEQKHFVEVPVELRAHLEGMKREERRRYWKKNKHEFK